MPMNDFILENQSEDVIYALAASPNFASDYLCYAARQSGLHISHDGGATWQSAFSSLNLPMLPPATAVAVSPDITLIVGVSSAILSSTDSGFTWATSVLPTPSPFITTIVASPD